MTVAAAGAVLGVLALLLGAGVWVGLALYAPGLAGLAIFRDLPVDKLLAQLTWNATTTPELIALPLFILMAEILFHSRLSASLFTGLAPWTTRLPGRLLHVNVLGCTMFAAISGSSAATTATVGRITLTELLRRGYDRDLAMGSLAGAGTLGFLIPPSIILIIYGVLAETSILKLFIAGIVPGLLLAILYMTWLGIRTSWKSSLAPDETETMSLADKVLGLRHLGPVVFLILAVLGSMYGGIASPSEAAAVGVLGALVVSAFQGTLTWETMRKASLGAVRTISMIGLIVAGAYFLSIAMGFLGVPRMIAGEIAALDLSPIALIVLLLVFYAILGCVLEGMSSIVMTSAHHAAAGAGGGVRQDLVRRVPGDRGGDGADHATRGLQPVRDSGDDRGAHRPHRPRDAAVLPDHGRPRAAHHLRSRSRDLPAERHPARQLKGARRGRRVVYPCRYSSRSQRVACAGSCAGVELEELQQHVVGRGAHDVAPGAELADLAAEGHPLILHARHQGAQGRRCGCRHGGPRRGQHRAAAGRRGAARRCRCA